MKSKLLTLLLSFVIACGLWAYVVTVVSPESEETFYDVPVILSGTSVLEERGLMILSDTKLDVDLHLMGNRLDLIKLNSANITVLADLSQITDPGVHTIRYAISYPGDIQSGNIEVLQRDPQYLTVEVVERSRKEIPVEVDYSGSVAEGHYAPEQDASVNYKFVTITGPKEMVDRIHHAKVTVDLEGRTETFAESLRFTLCDAEDKAIDDVSRITVNVSEVQVMVKVYMQKQLPIRVVFMPGELLDEELISYTTSVSHLVVAGNQEALEQLGDEIVLGPISLRDRLHDFAERFNISLPEGVILLSGATDVDVVVDVPPMQERTFWSVSRIVPVFVPEGLQVVVKTSSLNVKVRGMEEQVRALELEQLYITVDCSGVTMMDQRKTVTIEIRDAQGVVVVGTYEVEIIVTAIAEYEQVS